MPNASDFVNDIAALQKLPPHTVPPGHTACGSVGSASGQHM
jgi:hypothetical protein